MFKAMVSMIAIGAAVGLMLPAGSADAPAAEAAPRVPGEPVRIERGPGGHYYVHGEINGQIARFLVDTGATMVALTVEDAQRLGVPFSRSKFEIVGTGASGPVRGQNVMLDRLVAEGREVRQVRAAVIEGLEISLLGQAFLTRLGSVEMSADYMVWR